MFVGQDGAPPSNRDIVVYPRQKECHRVSELHPSVDPMSYPLLFPRGVPSGWDTDLLHHPKYQSKAQKRTRLTVLQFYSHQLMRREGQSILPHAGGRLFQQYCVDAYTKAESQRLNWVRYNQAKLRNEEYNVLRDWLSTTTETATSPSGPDAAVGGSPKVGRPVILPSSFSGGARAMQMNYQDAMAIVRRYGKPDLFITFTANPTWPEIADNLWPADHATNRPDIVARVFVLKLRALIADILQRSVMGVVIAYTWTLEFQKRGLPHAHILLILRAADKPRTPEAVDRLVSAEIPDKDDPRQARLHRIVKTSMLHGPCGVFASKAPCVNEQG